MGDRAEFYDENGDEVSYWAPPGAGGLGVGGGAGDYDLDDSGLLDDGVDCAPFPILTSLCQLALDQVVANCNRGREPLCAPRFAILAGFLMRPPTRPGWPACRTTRSRS